jgi:hypothetical protein
MESAMQRALKQYETHLKQSRHDQVQAVVQVEDAVESEQLLY